jgi:NAD(P)H-dependent flavin oxidoreductase YrpB (nitropropane dioxygenase family)
MVKFMGITVVIKDVDENAFRMLKAEAIKKGIKVGQAASQAFKLWVQEYELKPLKDVKRLKEAVKAVEEAGKKLKKIEGWSSVKVIRSWREQQKV